MTLHALVALAIFAGAGIAAAVAIHRTVAPRIARIQAALSGRGAF